ncbi:MAG: type II secretion system F family protein [Acidimicrobiia bacterium]|nr:type II secretion system F family protein [Acidimicrobiia bacterium]
MSRLTVFAGLALWIGLVLLLSELRWFSRRPLTERLRAYSSSVGTRQSRSGLLSVESFREVAAPLSRSIGSTAARMFGVSEELSVRLRRIHSPLDVTAFRTRQVGISLAVAGVSTLFAVAVQPQVVVALLMIIGGPILAFLVQEQQVASQSDRRQRRLFLELPVIAEQLGMLLSAGYSLGSALQRISTRGSGVVAEDLRIVGSRIRQGLSEEQALKEWAELADVDALDRLVSVLALNREAGDLGRLIHEEARSIRREVHRELLATIERRGQQVWIPVTVATLIPGVMFIAVPFIEALRLFTDA